MTDAINNLISLTVGRIVDTEDERDASMLILSRLLGYIPDLLAGNIGDAQAVECLEIATEAEEFLNSFIDKAVIQQCNNDLYYFIKGETL